MPAAEDKKRKRVVVEEVPASQEVKEEPKEEVKEEIKEEDKAPTEEVKPEILEEAASTKEISSEEKPPEPKKSSSPIFWILIPGIFLLGAILGGIVFYQRGISKGESQIENPAESPTTSASPSATPVATIDLTKYTIAVFNGSGISGEAGRAKILLTDAGFKVGTTANAASYGYTKTIIKAKTTVDETYLSALSAALGKSYVVDTAQTLATSSGDTVQVIIGSSKAE